MAEVKNVVLPRSIFLGFCALMLGNSAFTVYKAQGGEQSAGAHDHPEIIAVKNELEQRGGWMMEQERHRGETGARLTAIEQNQQIMIGDIKKILENRQ